MLLAIFLVLYCLIGLSIAALGFYCFLEDYWSDKKTEYVEALKKRPRVVISFIAFGSLLWPMALTAGGIAGCRALKKLIDNH